MPSTTPQDHKPKKTTKKAGKQRDTAQPIPGPESPDSKYAPNAWLSGGIGDTEDVVVPSGQTCLVRRPGMEGLIKAGVLHNVDSLSAIVDKKHIKRVEGRAEEGDDLDLASLMDDPEGMAEILNVVDKVVCHVVVKPEVHRTPNDATRRQPGVVYADMIDLMDKMFLFNYAVGGTRDLESFRGGLDDAVGGLEAGEGVHDETE